MKNKNNNWNNLKIPENNFNSKIKDTLKKLRILLIGKYLIFLDEFQGLVRIINYKPTNNIWKCNDIVIQCEHGIIILNDNDTLKINENKIFITDEYGYNKGEMRLFNSEDEALLYLSLSEDLPRKLPIESLVAEWER